MKKIDLTKMVDATKAFGNGDCGPSHSCGGGR